jgi:putative chitinase
MITKAHLKEICPSADDKIISDIETHLNQYMADYGVNTYLRVCHFIAQCAHESAHFTTLEEFASGAAYEGRKNLGNTQTGDGKRYKGRGMIQLTGRANYREMGTRLNVDLENNPKLAMTPKISVLTALEYWHTRKLNALADADNLSLITKKINGGYNGIEDRKKYLLKAKKVFANIDFNKPLVKFAARPENVVVSSRGEKSDYVKDIQAMFEKLGYDIDVDGDFGPQTEEIVKDFQLEFELDSTGKIDTNTLDKLISLVK